MQRQALLSIGEVARHVGMRPSAIRFYEAENLLPAPERQSGQRRYDPSVVQRLAQQAGFSVAEIRELFTGVTEGAVPSAQWRALAEQKLPEVRALIRCAQEMERWLEEGLRCECLNLGECRILEAATTRVDKVVTASGPL